MLVDSVSSTSSTTTTSSSSSSSSSSSVSDSYETFLTLLLKQLEVQDPTNPVDTTTFTTQIVQLSSLEQQMSTNDKLDELNSTVSELSSSTLGSGSSAISYYGKTVEAEGATTPLQDGEATWEYDMDTAASSVKLTITDSSGNTVYSDTSSSTAAGTHEVTWDGVGTDGQSYSSGTYTLSVTALDASGKAIDTTTRFKGTVTSVDSSSGTAVLSVGGVSVSADDVLSVS
ncbi:flagellar hook capping protein FlgD [Azospirillum thiophilum]|uniref:Basal-body rod modification protein FlgD n=1 Tax=Azospirillum thiophilum TaxID=528244 RepID=A0AAC8VZC9_9PROT|nr:flagellar hook capping FlgD N-terminal domain-containing protein [Azospirillum thiophilum]ALG72299.1 flagellar biosynthesis protein FlgD [Azospirillum thiophilum]KJR61263.1 flagellar hook capping protein FlgD [Azospirillum thiophilum]